MWCLFSKVCLALLDLFHLSRTLIVFFKILHSGKNLYRIKQTNKKPWEQVFILL
jgi:hypothetical protein